MKVEIREEVRENWGSRTGFVLAAVGSAVGLGNLWGFPYKLYSYGGGAFLIPYIIAMFLIGIPLMILEFSVGHMTQRAAPDAFRQSNRHFEFIGWWGVLLGFVIITYYPVILAYCFNFLWYSLVGIFKHGGNLPWAGEGMAGVQQAKDFFFNNYLNFNGSFELGKIQWHIVVTLAISWAAMYLCICKGVKMVSKVVWITVPLPLVMLAILAIRGLTLPGAGQGIGYYLNPDWSLLAEPTTWRWAFGQVFFSMSLAFGVMITYASFLHRKSDINNNATIIGLADFGTSFICGIAVFATLGGMAYAAQAAGNPIPVSEVVDKGPGLAFVAFPYALAQLPYSAWFSFIFFLTLVTLGVDSAFSITETILASIVDKTGWKRSNVLIIMSIIGFSAGLIFCTNGGLSWLDLADGVINGTWGIALLGLLECLVLGWLYRIRLLRIHANERSDWKIGVWWDILIRVIIPVVLSALFIWSLFDDVSKTGGLLHKVDGSWDGPGCIGLAIAIIIPVISVFISYKKHIKRKSDLPPSEPHGKILGREFGKKALWTSLFGIILIVITFIKTVLLKQEVLTGNISVIHGKLVPALCLLSFIICFVIMLLSGRKVFRAETGKSRPSFWLRSSAAVGTFGTGSSAGLVLAYVTLKHVQRAGERHIDLSGTSFIILAVVGLLVVGGLGWCFIRALNPVSALRRN